MKRGWLKALVLALAWFLFYISVIPKSPTTIFSKSGNLEYLVEEGKTERSRLQRFTYSIQPSSCKVTPGRSPSIVLFVPSRPGNAEDRAAVRETWGFHARLCNTRVIFGMGIGLTENQTRAVTAENMVYDDILQVADIVDSYHNQTELILSFFTWGQQNCRGASFIGKADEDSWISVYGVRKYIRQFPEPNSMYGYIARESVPQRRTGDKYYLSWEEYAKAAFPPYAAGHLYVFHYSDLRNVLIASTRLIKHWIDDVFIAGQIPELLKMKLVHMSEYSLYAWFNSTQLSQCPGRDFYIIHVTSAAQKRHMFYSNCTMSLRTAQCLDEH